MKTYNFEGKNYGTLAAAKAAVRKTSDGKNFITHWENDGTVCISISNENENDLGAINAWHGKRGGVHFCQN